MSVDKFKIGDLVNLRYDLDFGQSPPKRPDEFACLIIKTEQSHRSYGLPSVTNYHLLMPSGKYVRATEDQLVLVNHG